MNADDIQSKLVEAVEHGYLDSDVLDAANDCSISSRSAIADSRDALSSFLGDSPDKLTREECLEKLTSLLAGSIPRVNSVPKEGLKALFSYDGGLEMSFFGEWGLLQSGITCVDALKPLKQKCVEMSNSSPVVLGGVPFWLLPKGAVSGFGRYSFQLIVEEEGREKYRLLLHTTPSDKIAGVRVKASYQAFRYGRSLKAVHEEILELISAIGFIVNFERLSRVDFNLTINHSIDELNAAFNEDRIVNRCKEASVCGKRRFTSYRVGNINTIEFAVYDKIKELQERYDADKIADLEKYMGPATGLVDWTRYEFRLGRTFLHKVGIDTVSDFLDNILGLVNYLTFDWFLVKKNSTRTGRKINYKVADFWQIVRLCFLCATLSEKPFITCEKTVSSRNLCQALSLNIIGRCVSTVASNLPKIKLLPSRKFRKKIKNILKVSVGCMVSAISMSCPANMRMERPDFQKTLIKTVSFLSDEAYEKYCKSFALIDGVERDVENYLVDSPSLFTRGAV